MNNNVLNDEIIKNARINKSYTAEKGLVVGNNYSLYANVQVLYLKGLENYIETLVDLKKYDDLINNSGLDLGLIPDKLKQPYHIISSMNLNHIYIRNFLFIEKLSTEQLNVFINKVNNNDYTIDSEIENIIKSTYKDILADNYIGEKYYEVASVVYDRYLPNNLAHSDELVFVIQYGRGTNNLDKDEFFENRNKQLELLDNISKQLCGEVEKALNMKVKVLIRNMFGQ